MTTLEKIREKRAEILAIAAKYGATNLRVFGSVAREEDDDDSDVDFLVDWDADHTLFDRVDIQEEIKTFLNKETDIVVAKNLSGYRKERILNEAIPV